MNSLRNQEPRSAGTARPQRKLAVALVCGVAMLAAAGHASAQSATLAQRSFINLGFEVPDLQTTGCRVYLGEQYVPGWTTTHGSYQQQNSGGCNVTPPVPFTWNTANNPASGPNANILEIWRGPRSNGSGGAVTAPEGTQFAELNAEQLSRLSQNVCLVVGEPVQWQFSHRGRASDTTQDQMRFLIGSTPIVTVGTTNNGSGGVVDTHLGTATSTQITGNTSWRAYSGQFISTTGGLTNIGFEALSGSSTTGNFLDAIQIFLKPFIELAGASPQTVEGTSTGVPQLRVAGTFVAATVITVQVTGGTAVLGADFTTPSGGNTFTLTIPAGTYDGTDFPLGLTAIGNTDIDGSRTVQLQLVPSPDDFVVASTSNCGDDAIADSTWTILDDDLDLQIEKTVNPTTAAPGDTVEYTLTVTHNGGVAGDNTVVTDPAVTGLTCPAANPVACTASGGAICHPNAQNVSNLQGSGIVIPTLPSGGSVVLTFQCTVD